MKGVFPSFYKFGKSGFRMELKQIKAKRIGDLITVSNKNPHHLADKKYNHLRIEFNNDEKSLLFTDHQIRQSIYRASKNKEDLPNLSWIRKVLEIELIEGNRIADLQAVENQDKLPAACKKYNHVLVDIAGSIQHLLFTDNDIKVALERADKNKEDIPETSWIRDILD